MTCCSALLLQKGAARMAEDSFTSATGNVTQKQMTQWLQGLGCFFGVFFLEFLVFCFFFFVDSGAAEEKVTLCCDLADALLVQQ